MTTLLAPPTTSASTSAPTSVAARAVDVSKIYGKGEAEVRALDSVSVDFATGRFTAIMGPSGSGKSTLMHALAGLDTITSGAVYIGDTNLAKLNEKKLTKLRRDRVGFVFQAYNLIPTLTAIENITLPMRLAGKRPDKAWLNNVVETVGLKSRLSHRPSELSGGQQQRVAVARALASQPEIIFADEPTGNLDSRTGAEILHFMRQAVREFGQTIVMVTHDPVAASYSDRAVFLADGQIVDELVDPTADGVFDRMRTLGSLSIMFRLTLKNISAKKSRFFLTSLSVILGVAFMAGTLVLTDTIKKSYDELIGTVYKETDAVVQSGRTVGSGEDETRGTIDAAVLEQVRAVPGVKAADANVLGVAMVVGKDGELLDASESRAIPIALAWSANAQLNPMELVDGHAPAANEIVIDKASADAGNFAVGATISVLSKAGAQEYVLAGIATYGGKNDAAGAQVVAFAPETAASVLGDPGRFDSVNIIAAPGVSEADVVANVQAVLGNADLEVLTGTQAIEQAREAAGAKMSFLNTFLMTFALVALLVGSFVIYNTFSITVAQRTRETALLRAIGAKRKQVMRSLVFESVLTGLFASAVGVLAGIGTAKGIAKVFTVFDIDLPASGTVVNSSTIVISMITGTIVTVLAAYLPARKAGKVPPIAAMRDVAVDRTGTSAKRIVLGTMLTLGGATVIALGLSGGGVGPVGLGALAIFVGISALGPVIARPFARLIGSPLPRVRGMAGTIARENATRNPRRTSATASALMVGVGLVVFITVFAASAKAAIFESVDNSVRDELVVETAWGMGGLSTDAATKVDALPETSTVSAMRYTMAEVDGSSESVLGFAPEYVESALDLKPTSGDLSALGPNDLAVSEKVAEDNLWTVGTTVPMVFAETGAQQFTVTAIYSELGPTDGYLISMAGYEANVADRVDNYLLINNADGYSVAQTKAAVEKALDEYPNAKVMTRDEYKGSVAAEIGSMLNLVYVLLFMALAIALFGIANTLALSVFERTREIGLLRAVGMSRKQLRSSVRWESVLIALLGATLGTAIGLGFGYAMVEAMKKTEGMGELTIPTTQLVWIVALSAVAAVIAAALPARRAARMDVLGAIKTD